MATKGTSGYSGKSIATTLGIDALVFVIFVILFFTVMRRKTNFWAPKFVHDTIHPERNKRRMMWRSNLKATTTTASTSTSTTESSSASINNANEDIDVIPPVDVDDLNHSVTTDESLTEETPAASEYYELLSDERNLRDSVLNLAEANKMQDMVNGGRRVGLLDELRLVFRLLFPGRREDHKYALACGHETAVYLSFQKWMLTALGACMVLGLAILLPVNLSGTNPVESTGSSGLAEKEASFLFHTTVARVMNNPDRLWAHVVLAWVFVLIFLGALHCWYSSSTVRQFIGAGNERVPLISEFAAIVRHLPSNLTSVDELVALLQPWIKEDDSGKVISAQLVMHDYHDLVRIQEDLMKATRKEAHFKAPNLINKPLKRYRYGCIPIKTQTTRYQHWKQKKADLALELSKWEEGMSKKQVKARFAHQPQVTEEDKRDTNESQPTTKMTQSSASSSGSSTPTPIQQTGQGIKRDADDTTPERSSTLTVVTQPAPETDEQLPTSSYAGYAFVVFNTAAARDTAIKKGPNIAAALFNHLINNSSTALSSSTQPFFRSIFRRFIKRTYSRPSITIQAAPEPEDIQWKSITQRKPKRVARGLISHFLFAVMIIFFSSPVTIFSSGRNPVTNTIFDYELNEESWSNFKASFVFQYLPTALMAMFTALVPVLIERSVMAERMLSLSRERRAIMKRVYVFVLLNTVIMPLFALGTVASLLELATSPHIWKAFELMFLPDSGAFFINLLIQFALLGAVFFVISPKKYLEAWLFRRRAHTEYDKAHAATKPMFKFERTYPRIIGILGIVIVFSVFMPLILVVGFFFWSIQHILDRYNFVFLFRRSERRLAKNFRSYRYEIRTISLMVAINLMLFELILIGFFVFKKLQAHYACLIVLFIFTLLYSIFLARKFMLDDLWSVGKQFPVDSSAYDKAKLQRAYLPSYELEEELRMKFERLHQQQQQHQQKQQQQEASVREEQQLFPPLPSTEKDDPTSSRTTNNSSIANSPSCIVIHTPATTGSTTATRRSSTSNDDAETMTMTMTMTSMIDVTVIELSSSAPIVVGDDPMPPSSDDLTAA